MKANETILVVDDEEDVVNLVRYNLQKASYDVLTAVNGVDGLRLIRDSRPDVVVLDLMLPRMDGLSVCREVRGDPEVSHTPILMLTAKNQQKDRIKGLQDGADDYLTKPFSTRELILRVGAILRRSGAADSSTLVEFGGFRMDKSAFEFHLEGKRLDLTVTEFKLLALLIDQRGRILSRDKLLHEVWGYQNPIDTRTVDTHMRRLRSKLEGASVKIETIRGEGYRFRANV